MMDNAWIRVYVTSNYQQAQLIKMKLKENEIETIEINKQDSMYLFGDIELYVSKLDYNKAIDLINEAKYE